MRAARTHPHTQTSNAYRPADAHYQPYRYAWRVPQHHAKAGANRDPLGHPDPAADPDAYLAIHTHDRTQPHPASDGGLYH